ncbi:MAG: winged helix-turn-helix domain-containing protein [Pseudonocardia sp.]|nr:winged helix-turn-helix domain-containing protein [Pseudonocardia sp.]
MQIGVLGAVTARRSDDGRAELAPAGPRLRGLLARLALDAGHPVATSVLVDALWGGQPPDGVGNALQSLVSRLRRALGADLVRTAPGGYRLDIAPDGVDALRFATLRRAATDEPDPRRACELLSDALALWRGPALADVRDVPFAEPTAVRLAGTRADAVEQLAARGRDAGAPATGLDALTALLDEQPLRESTAVALAWGLLAGGRQADALDVLDRTRDALAESLGVDPGPDLARTRMAVLRGEHEATPRSRPAVTGVNGGRTAASSAPVPPPALSPTALSPVVPGPPATGSRPVVGRNGSSASAPPPGGTPFSGTPPRRAPALTTFVGRDADVARVRELLTGSRLVTVTGPGGAGKTRLSAEVVGPLEDAVAVAELAPLTGDDQLPSALLHAVGGPDLVLRNGSDPVDTTERLYAALAGRDLLLVLDNCEHLVGAVADLVQTLLDASAGLRVLATSREPLGITGEVLHPLGALSDEHAARLFADRAAAVLPGFDGEGDTGVVAEICRRLDGQPLPIELAAARVRTLSTREIADRLDDRFRLLTTGSRTALPRHQTLRAVVDWSWDLLTVAERRLAVRMGVFAGPVDAGTVERVCGDDPDDAFDLLSVLVDKSLVLAAPDPDGGATRYLMLETIREYAAARLGESGEREAITAAHAGWALALLERAEPALRTRDQLDALGSIRRAEGEITLALRRAVAARDVQLAHALLAGMQWSWTVRGSLSSAERWAAEVWALPEPEPGRSTAINRTFRALLRAARGDSAGASADLAALAASLPDLPRPWHPAVTLAEPVRRAFGEADDGGLTELVDNPADRWLQGAAAQMLATVAENEGDLDGQRRMLRIAHARFTEFGDRFGLGMSVFSLGELEELAGESDAARAAFDEAVALATELGNLDDAPQFRMRLAGLAVRTGDLDEARAQMRAALAETEGRDATWFGHVDRFRVDIERRGGDTALARALLDRAEQDMASGAMPGTPQRDASLLEARAAIELDEGRLDAARDLLDRAAGPARTSGDGPVIARVAETSARWAVAAGDPERAGELLGVAITRRGTLDHGDPEVRAVLAAVRAALGETGADTAMSRGRSLPRDHPPGASSAGA